MSDKREPTVEERLAEWAKQSGARVETATWGFVGFMRLQRSRGMGFGEMMSLIEWEWRRVSSERGESIFAPGPMALDQANRRIEKLEAALGTIAQTAGVIRSRIQTLAHEALQAEPEKPPEVSVERRPSDTSEAELYRTALELEPEERRP